MSLQDKRIPETLAGKVAFLEQFLTDERREKIDRVLSSRLTRFSIVLENIYDPHNISAVMRSADGLGFHRLFIIEQQRIARFSRTITTGAERWLDIEIFGDTEEGLKRIRERGYKLAVGILSDEAVNFYDVDWFSHRWAIVLGNEHEGVTEKAIEMADLHFIIPMYGFVQSFNISVTAAIVMAHLRYLCDMKGIKGDLTEEERLLFKYRWLTRDLGIEI